MKPTTRAKKIIETLSHIGVFITENKGKQCSNQFVRWQECQNGDVWGAQQRFLSECKRRNIIAAFMGDNTFTIGDVQFNVQ